MFIDALARAGVKNGMKKDVALKIAAQSVLGSAKLISESDTHPFDLIDQVCSQAELLLRVLPLFRQTALKQQSIMQLIKQSIRTVNYKSRPPAKPEVLTSITSVSSRRLLKNEIGF